MTIKVVFFDYFSQKIMLQYQKKEEKHEKFKK